MLYGTGLGAVAPAVKSGVAAPSGPLATVTRPVVASIDGAGVAVAYAGLAPGFAGLYQINLQVPSDLKAGNHVLKLSAGSNRSLPLPVVE